MKIHRFVLFSNSVTRSDFLSLLFSYISKTQVESIPNIPVCLSLVRESILVSCVSERIAKILLPRPIRHCPRPFRRHPESYIRKQSRGYDYYDFWPLGHIRSKYHYEFRYSRVRLPRIWGR